MSRGNVCPEKTWHCSVAGCERYATHEGAPAYYFCCKHFDCSALRKVRERERVKGRGRSVMYGAAKDLAWLIEMIEHNLGEIDDVAPGGGHKERMQEVLESAVLDWVTDRVPKIVDALWGAAGGTGSCDGGYEPPGLDEDILGGDGPDD